MSELSKLLQSTSVAANPANPANPLAEISKISNFSRRAYPKRVVGNRDWSESPPVQSVDEWSKRLRESSGGELRQAAEDDWDEVSNDPAKLIAFADLLAITQIRESGSIPDTYTATTTCRNCGDVPIFENCLPRVDGCVWCLNGLTAPPISGHDT